MWGGLAYMSRRRAVAAVIGSTIRLPPPRGNELPTNSPVLLRGSADRSAEPGNSAAQPATIASSSSTDGAM